MSEVAGRMSIQKAAHYLEKMNGGRGKLLGGVPGVRPSEVLILGGGTVGTNAAFMALGMGASVTIVDNSKGMIKKLKESKISSIRGDATNLPISNERFDVAFLIHLIHHINRDQHKSLIEESYRILKKDGEIFVVDLFFKNTFFNLLFAIIEIILSGKTYHIPSKKVIEYFEDTGFKDIKLTLIGKNVTRYLIIAKK